MNPVLEKNEGGRNVGGPTPGRPMSPRRTIVHFIAAPAGGGAEAMLANLVSAMDGSRWRTVILVMDGRPWPQAMAELRQAGAEVHDLEASAFLRWSTVTKLTRLLRQTRPDVLQTWMHHADFVGSCCALAAGVKKIVWGIHCREIHRNPGDSDARVAIFRFLLGLMAKAVPARILSCSAAALEDHVPMGYPEARMVWVPNGIDTDRFRPNEQARQTVRQQLGIPPEAPLIGYVGRFHEMKNLPMWLKAAAILQSRRPKTHFWLCGGEEWALEDGQRAALSVIPNRSQVHFTPFRADPEQVYPALDVFSLSSRTEACPMTVMEAMSCGVPCVTTDVGDCARLMESLGLVVPVNDAEALAAAWEQALDKPPTADALHKRAVEKFDIAVAARGYEHVYEEALVAS